MKKPIKVKIYPIVERAVIKIGKTYKVPCVYGVPSFFSILIVEQKPQWWPILVPSHEDSEYIRRIRLTWRQIDINKQKMIEEVYYECDLNSPHHFHLDARFIQSEWITSMLPTCQLTYEGLIFPQSYDIEYKNLEMVRIFTTTIDPRKILSEKFVEDFKGKKAKCHRCPHKGIDLKMVPVTNGIIKCPAHGLEFNSRTLKCIN